MLRVTVLLTVLLAFCHGFSSRLRDDVTRSSSVRLFAKAKMAPEEIKRQLQEYLDKRRQVNADELAKQEKGRVIGGTKGNPVLEYISGAPNKEQVVEKIPNVFDYDELMKYGYSNLVTPIMELGGRPAAYKLMDLPLPASDRYVAPVKSAPPLVIDRTGETDPARYSGLKLGQVLNDDVLGQALQETTTNKKKKQKLMEEEYVRPFANVKNSAMRSWTPDWTPERLDEYGKQVGQAQSWARQAKLGEFQSDPAESITDVEGMIRAYSVLSTAIIAVGWGRSTTPFLQSFLGISNPSNFVDLLHLPATALLLASGGSALVCGLFLAPPLNRKTAVWAIKGWMGGPVAIATLKGLPALESNLQIQQRQQEEQAKNQTR